MLDWINDLFDMDDLPVGRSSPQGEANLLPRGLERTLRQLLEDCQSLYRSAARRAAHSKPDPFSSPEQYAELLDDLHRGVLIKTLVEIAHCDKKWNQAERQAAMIVLHHVWGVSVDSDGLTAALKNVIKHSEVLKWSELLRPFATVPELSHDRGEIQSLILRLASIIAKADSRVSPAESQKLEELKRDLDLVLFQRSVSTQDSRLHPVAPAQQIAAALNPSNATHSPSPRTSNSPVTKAPSSGKTNSPSGSATHSPSGSATHSPSGSATHSPSGSATHSPSGSATHSPSGRVGPNRPGEGCSTNDSSSSNAPSDESSLTPEERQAMFDEAMAELDGLIGLDSIKSDVRQLVDFLKVQSARREHGLPTAAVGLHAVFEGNPGTGKTTVARIISRLLCGLGILETGQTIETDRSGLVAQYAGQTSPRTNAKIDEALGGVLFLDEAYSLVSEGSEDSYGEEALQTMLKRIEDDRDRFVAVLAGYPRPMEKLLKSNPGLTSRFQRTYAFPDYSAKDLLRIFYTFCKQYHYRLPKEARIKLLKGFQQRIDQKDEHFGNGRLARNLFEESIRHMSSRIVSITPLTREVLTTIHPDDIRF
ncbi:MAG: AAA family ATPase [Aureliella sp.]